MRTFLVVLCVVTVVQVICALSALSAQDFLQGFMLIAALFLAIGAAAFGDSIAVWYHARRESKDPSS